MTGRPPGAAPPESTLEHDAERVRVLEEVVKGYADHVEDDPEAMPEEIRRNMANALAFYADDIHDIIGLHGDFSTRELSTRPNDVDVDRATMADFIRGIAEDAEAFRMVRESHLALVAEGIRGLGREDFTEGSDEAQGVALVGGNTMGVLDRIGAEALGARHDDEAGRKEWIEAYGKQGTGGNPEVFFSPRRNSGYLEDMFRERADRLGALTEVPGNGDAGLHPKITEVIRTEYRTAS